MAEANMNKSENQDILGTRLQNILNSLSKCKIDFTNEKEESKKIREINLKLELELKEARELEKSHRYHLLSSREMIGNLQETVSQLVHLKRDAKKLKDEMLTREKTITAMERSRAGDRDDIGYFSSRFPRDRKSTRTNLRAEADKENLVQKHNESIAELRNSHERHIEELTVINERKIQQVQHESDTQIAQFTCVIEELRAKIKEMEAEGRDKMNVVVLEYEEKIQRGAAQVAQLQEQLARQAARTESNIDAYRRRLEELEDKLKQSQFKQYLAQSTYQSQFESQVERPYSAARDPYSDTCSVDMNPVFEGPTSKMTSENKAPKQSTLQVMYYGNKTPAARIEKKGQFNIGKKRKLYNDKDFQDF